MQQLKELNSISFLKLKHFTIVYSIIREIVLSKQLNIYFLFIENLMNLSELFIKVKFDSVDIRILLKQS